MSPRLTRIAIMLLLIASLSGLGGATPAPKTLVCFTPGTNCTQLIVDTLASATTSLLVQAYSFTSAPIAKALVEAHKRGGAGAGDPR
jgi:phosphatidylserine/phosphatidylglycerophosphate/cardiolipin synthase-like enzyme